MKYCYLEKNTVQEIIPEFVEIFPNIPIQERYSKEFLDKCIEVEEDISVEVGYTYEDGNFKESVSATPTIVEEPADPEKVAMAETIIELSNQLETLQGGN
ncbi:hypothetical protein [Anaerovorax odorimutans]|uniref:hypothetical protein n=1 Tax=Anaerovorax odorimutans TaxID=109327 RepID=UPI000421E5B0|nr:hypothetical protein [Anaerovorax odorimutans]